jgi:hypothetical protein
MQVREIFKPFLEIQASFSVPSQSNAGIWVHPSSPRPVQAIYMFGTAGAASPELFLYSSLFCLENWTAMCR